MLAIVAQYTEDFKTEANGRFVEIANKCVQIDDVELITSSFSHGKKERKKITCSPQNCKLTLVEAPAYKKNVSLSRMHSCRVFAKNVYKYLRTLENVNLVYCAVPSLDVGVAVQKYCKEKKISMVLDVQDLWPDAFYMILNIPLVSSLLFYPLKIKADKLYSSTDNIITVSQTYLDRATKAVSHEAKRQLVAFLGTSLKKFDTIASEVKEIKSQDIVIGYIGTLSYSYDLNIVIKAIAEVQKRQEKHIRFKVMGSGELQEKFEEYAQQEKIDAIFMGYLPYDLMVKELIQCDIAVNPIVKKSAGSIINKVGDYAAAGLPVINTQECKEYRDLIEKYHCGINCRVGSWEDVASAIEELINDESMRIEMGRNARRLAEDKFDRDKSYVEIRDFVRGIYEDTGN